MTRTAWTLILAFMVAGVASSQTRSRITWEKVTLNLSPSRTLAAERGWLEVPERHSTPNGPKIRLHVLRLPTTAANNRAPIIWLDGGPGNAGTRAPLGTLYPVFEALRAHGDVIVIDQRGTGSSEPSLAVPGSLDLPSDKSINSPEAKQRLITVAESIRNLMRDRGVDLAAYNTIESADDVNSLRQALGIEKVVLWAHSYGTHLALAVIKRHGTHIERAILGGVNGLDQRWREPLDGDRLLTRVAEFVRKDPVVAKLAPDFPEQVRRVFAQLEQEPIALRRGDSTIVIGKSEIQAQVAISSGQIAFVRSLPWMFAKLEKRSGLEEIADGIQRTVRQRPIGTAMTYAMHISSGVSTERAARIESQVSESLFGNAINWAIGDQEFAKALGVPDLGDDFRAPFRSNVPVLLISGTLDGRTSESDARIVGQQFNQAIHVVRMEHPMTFGQRLLGYWSL